MISPEPLLLQYQGEVPVPAGREFISSYIQIPFEVPAAVGEMILRLRYSPAEVNGIGNLITLGLFDPAGFRGNAHRRPPDEQVRLAADGATVGFIPGPLPAGTWLAQLAVHAVLPDARPCQYTLDIELRVGRDGQDGPPAAVRWQPQQDALRGQPGWYRGELHSHTLHSDADWPAGQLIAASQKRGLDFLFITDHNTHSVYYELAGTQPEGLLLIPGIELTTFEGHALVLGIRDWIDWRCGYAGRSMQDAAREIQQAGGLFIIAHPFAAGSPFCTGCRWDYADFSLPGADGIEVWNGQWRSEGDKNPDGLRLWHELQKQGVHITATAGTDIHTARDWEGGAPVVYVHAHSLSAAAVLEALRGGRVILSSGPWIDLQVHAEPGGAPAGVGETCLGAAQDFTLSAEWSAVPQAAQLVIWNSQDVLEVVEVSGTGTLSYALKVEREEHVWIELYSTDGALLAMTNPIQVLAQPSGKTAG